MQCALLQTQCNPNRTSLSPWHLLILSAATVPSPAGPEPLPYQAGGIGKQEQSCACCNTHVFAFPNPEISGTVRAAHVHLLPVNISEALSATLLGGVSGCRIITQDVLSFLIR